MRFPYVVGLLALVAAVWLYRSTTRERQAETCWHIYGRDDVLQDGTQECLMLRYGWNQEDAALEALDRRIANPVRATAPVATPGVRQHSAFDGLNAEARAIVQSASETEPRPVD